PEINAFWQRCEASGLPSTTKEGQGFRVGRIPLNPGQLSITLDGRPASARRLGDWPEQDIGSLRWARYPSVFSHIHADYAIFVRDPVTPRARPYPPASTAIESSADPRHRIPAASSNNRTPSTCASCGPGRPADRGGRGTRGRSC